MRLDKEGYGQIGCRCSGTAVDWGAWLPRVLQSRVVFQGKVGFCACRVTERELPIVRIPPINNNSTTIDDDSSV
jgi:hypothetical protein